MKKFVNVFILSLIFITLFAGLSTAEDPRNNLFGNLETSSGPELTMQSNGIVGTIHSLITGAYQLVRPVLELIIGETPNTNLFLAKILLAVVVFALVWKTLDKVSFFNSESWVHWVVAIAVSLLSIRWIGNSEIVTSVLLPYSAMGIAITAGLPFVIWFTLTEFSEDTPKVWRKISWIFFIVIFIALWFTRYQETFTGGEPVGNFAFIYLITAVFGGIAYIADPMIQKKRNEAKNQKFLNTHQKNLRREFQRKMHKLGEDLNDGIISHEEYTTEMNTLKRRIKELSRDAD